MTKRILALDFGFARIGVALSDPNQIIASPLENITGSRDVVKAAENTVLFISPLEKEIEKIVIGLPLLLNGKDSERTTAVRHFAQALAEKTAIAIELFDERLTTVQAERLLSSNNMRRKERAQVVDKVSALILLQTYLDQQALRRE